MGRFVIRKTQTGFVFCLKAANGETIATSEVYQTLAGCKKGVCSVVRNAAAETLYLDGETPQSVRNPRYELYQDAAGRYRFRLRAKKLYIRGSFDQAGNLTVTQLQISKGIQGGF